MVVSPGSWAPAGQSRSEPYGAIRAQVSLAQPPAAAPRLRDEHGEQLRQPRLRVRPHVAPHSRHQPPPATAGDEHRVVVVPADIHPLTVKLAALALPQNTRPRQAQVEVVRIVAQRTAGRPAPTPPPPRPPEKSTRTATAPARQPALPLGGPPTHPAPSTSLRPSATAGVRQGGGAARHPSPKPRRAGSAAARSSTVRSGLVTRVSPSRRISSSRSCVRCGRSPPGRARDHDIGTDTRGPGHAPSTGSSHAAAAPAPDSTTPGTAMASRTSPIISGGSSSTTAESLVWANLAPAVHKPHTEAPRRDRFPVTRVTSLCTGPDSTAARRRSQVS